MTVNDDKLLDIDTCFRVYKCKVYSHIPLLRCLT